ncbi:MAG: flagellar hook assembly protein FlgD [Proteobacteria bacterium]|nr:flagellar hook assembly protein FlgD [Pseudomonadota bacterium]
MNTIEQVFAPITNTSTSKGDNELGQEDFLKLLVAQLKNQDPSNPADNGEFLGQIAQFSMVSGIDDLGDSFDSIAGSLFANQAMQAATLVGKEVLVETNEAMLIAGAAVEGTLDLDEDAIGVKLQIRDAAGSLVNTMQLGNLGAGIQRFNWDGLDADGNQLASGVYSIAAEGLVNGTLEAMPLQIFTTVQSVSVDRSNTIIVLHLVGDNSVGISQIREYR